LFRMFHHTTWRTRQLFVAGDIREFGFLEVEKQRTTRNIN